MEVGDHAVPIHSLVHDAFGIPKNPIPALKEMSKAFETLNTKSTSSDNSVRTPTRLGQEKSARKKRLNKIYTYHMIEKKRKKRKQRMMRMLQSSYNY